MDLRVLIYPNPTELDKSKKRFLFWKDSGLIYAKNIIKTLPWNYRFYWLIPDMIPESSRSWFTESNKNVEAIPYNFLTEGNLNALSFSTAYLNQYFGKGRDIDIIINFQPEVTLNLKYAFLASDIKPGIITVFQDLTPDTREIMFHRRIDGAKNSDLLYFKSEAALQKFNKTVTERTVDQGFLFNSRVRRPPANVWGDEDFPLGFDGKRIILFNQRINDPLEIQGILSSCKLIYEKRQDFVLWLTDENVSEDYKINVQGNYPFVHFQSIKPQHYGYFLSQVDFAVFDSQNENSWNMAVFDCLAYGCFVLVPKNEVFMGQLFQTAGALAGIYRDGELSENIERLLDEPKAGLKARAKMLVEKGFTQGELNLVNEDIAEILVHRKSANINYTEIEDIIKYIKSKQCVSRADLKAFYQGNMDYSDIRRAIQSTVGDDTSSTTTLYNLNPTYKPYIRSYRNQPLFEN